MGWQWDGMGCVEQQNNVFNIVLALLWILWNCVKCCTLWAGRRCVSCVRRLGGLVLRVTVNRTNQRHVEGPTSGATARSTRRVMRKGQKGRHVTMIQRLKCPHTSAAGQGATCPEAVERGRYVAAI